MADASVDPWYITKPNKGDMFNFSGLSAFIRFTDASGKTVFPLIPSDNTERVNFWVHRDGFTSPQRWIWDPASSKADLTATLVPRVHLAGRVIGQDDRPVGRAQVRIGGAGYQFDDFREQLETKDDGTFALDVDPEMYYVFVAQKDHQVSPATTELIHKTPPGSPIELKLQAGIRVYGTVTAGPNNEPLPNLFVSLLLWDHSYEELPAAQQFPGGLAGRKTISAVTWQHVKSDKQGNFEFYSCPGELQTDCGFGFDRNTQNFTLSERPKQIAIHFASNAPVPTPLHGRIVRADQPEIAISGATLSGFPLDLDNHGIINPQGTSDPSGKFEIRRAFSDMYLNIESADRSLGTVVLVKLADDNLTIPLGPTSSAHGRLLDSAGQPWAKQRIEYGMTIRAKESKLSTQCFGGRVNTESDGTFTLHGMVSGHDYEFTLVTADKEGAPGLWRRLGRVTPNPGRSIQLGDVSVKK